MKQLSLLGLIICLSCTIGKAATVSGTVINSVTSAAIANQKVFIYDSLTFWQDSTLTNTSGVYSFTIPSTIPTGDLIMLSTYGCGTSRSNSFFYAGTSVTSNFSMCSGTFQLHGNIYQGGSPNSGPAMVWLIRKQYDPILMDTTLTAIDSQTITGSSYSFTYGSMPTGILLLKAALKPSNTNYSNFLPTYFYTSLVWSGAITLTTSNFYSSNLTHIILNAGTNTGGPGFIGGSVLLGANKSAGVGDPLDSRILILTTAAGQAVGYTYSNVQGQFSFSNLAYGTYKIFGDAWGKTNPALTVTISASNASVGNVLFEENSSTFKGKIGGLGVEPGNPLQSLSLYPNPAHGFVSLDGLNAINGSKTLILKDVTGALLSHTAVAAGANATISTGTLPAGLYLLQVQTEVGTASYKFVKE